MPEPIQAEILHSTMAVDALKLRLAAQLAPLRWKTSLAELAKQLDAGRPLEEAIGQTQTTMPRELGNLVGEALSVPDPTRLILDAVKIRASASTSRHELVGIIAYPIVLLGIALTVGLIFSLVLRNTSHLIALEDLGLRGGQEMRAAIEDQHHAMVGLSILFVWLLCVMAAIALLGPPWALSAVLGGVLLIGRPLRWICLREILERYQIFIAQGVSPVDTCEIAARSLRHGSLAIVASSVAERIKSGMPWGRSLTASALCDGLCRPALYLLDSRGHEIQVALHETIGLIGQLTQQHCRTLTAILPAFLLLVVGTIIWSSLCTYVVSLLPLISMLTSLA